MHMRAVEHIIQRGLCTPHAAWVDNTESCCWYEEELRSSRYAHAMLNVPGLPCVLPDNMLSAGQEGVMSRPALTGRRMNAEQAHPARAADHHHRRTAQRAPRSVSGWAALTSVLGGVDVRTAVAEMAVATAVVDNNAA
jgi:hypothetical protein